MRLPRVRFTVRRLMVAVAIAALAVGGLVLAQRSMAYSATANEHAARQIELIKAADDADAKRMRIAQLQAEIRLAKEAGDLKRAGFLWTAHMPTDGPMPP